MASVSPRRRLARVLCAMAALLAGTAFAQSLPPDLPLRRGSDAAAESGLWVPGLLLLGICIGAAFYVARRRGWIAGGRAAIRHTEHALTRVSSHALTPQASVHVVQWNGEEYLVGCTSQQVTLLARRAGEAGEEIRP